MTSVKVAFTPEVWLARLVRVADDTHVHVASAL
jgi:hypothetical protein